MPPSSRSLVSLVATLALGLAAAGATGCSQSVLVRSDHPKAHLYVEGEYQGPVDEKGTFVDVGPGFSPVSWELADDDGQTLTQGAFEREIRWIPLVLGLAGAALCVPACGLSAVFVVNPLLWLAPVYLFAGTLAGFGTIAASPGWASLPCGFIGAVCGLWPLGMLTWAERLAPVVWAGTGPPPDEALRPPDPREPDPLDESEPVEGDALEEMSF